MKRLNNQKLATRISIITTAITLAGMLLWLIVSTNAASMVKNDITNQMTDAVESTHDAVSEERSTQTKTLNSLLGQFRIK